MTDAKPNGFDRLCFRFEVFLFLFLYFFFQEYKKFRYKPRHKNY